MSLFRKALLPIGIVSVCTASITKGAFAQERYLEATTEEEFLTELTNAFGEVRRMSFLPP